MALTMDTVASVNGLTVTTTQGYTLTRIGNKSLREGDTIYTDGKYVYGMEGNGGKQLPMLPSVNYLFFNPYSTDTMKPGIYGFYKSFSKPVFVCDAERKALFIGANNAYQGTNNWGSGVNTGLEHVKEISSEKEIISSYPDTWGVYPSGLYRPGLDQCVASNGDYLELRAGADYIPNTSSRVILFRNGEIVDYFITQKKYGYVTDLCGASNIAHVNEDGSYQFFCSGISDRHNNFSDYGDKPDEYSHIIERAKIIFPPTPPVGANVYKDEDDGKFHLYKDTNSGTEEIFATSSIDEICSYTDPSGRKPFSDCYFALYEFISYSEEVLWKCDSAKKGEREKIAYYINESLHYECNPISNELPIDGAKKRLICCYNDYDVRRNGISVPTYETYAIYENTDTGFFERYWFCTEKYNKFPLDKDDIDHINYGHKNGSADMRIGTDLSGKPIMMTCYFDMSEYFMSHIKYTCCGYTSDSFIKNAVQISEYRYALLTGEGIIVVNTKTGEHRKSFDGDVCYYNTRLVKTSRNVINTIKRVLPKKGGD